MRHTPRAFRTDLVICHECLRDPCISAKWASTKLQIADMFTKPGFTSEQWLLLCQLAQLVPSSQQPQLKKFPVQEPSPVLPRPTSSRPTIATMSRHRVAIDHNHMQLSVRIPPLWHQIHFKCPSPHEHMLDNVAICSRPICALLRQDVTSFLGRCGPECDLPQVETVEGGLGALQLGAPGQGDQQAARDGRRG